MVGAQTNSPGALSARGDWLRKVPVPVTPLRPTLHVTNDKKIRGAELQQLRDTNGIDDNNVPKFFV